MLQEVSYRNVALGHDRVGVRRAVFGDVLDRAGDAVDDAHGHDGVEIFGVPIVFRRRLDAGVDR